MEVASLAKGTAQVEAGSAVFLCERVRRLRSGARD
jgi:hypothetical protein